MGRSKSISASAVRNQENGTNGIPVAVAEAYASILKVDTRWLLFGGAEPEELNGSKYDYQSDELGFGEIFIPVVGMVSGRWIPDLEIEGDDQIALLIPGWSGLSKLSAFEVADGSLEPHYPRGSFLIVVDQDSATLNDGVVVLAARINGDQLQSAVRILKAIRDGVDLAPVGPSSPASEPLVRGGRREPSIAIQSVVVATYYALPPGKGPPLDASVRLAVDRPTFDEFAAVSGDILKAPKNDS
jgi:hypothetical protein